METKSTYHNGIQYACLLEVDIAKALEAANISFTAPKRLDFYLPDYDIFIEVKRYHTERSNDQLSTQDNVILVQGMKCVDFLCKLLNTPK